MVRKTEISEIKNAMRSEFQQRKKSDELLKKMLSIVIRRWVGGQTKALYVSARAYGIEIKWTLEKCAGNKESRKRRCSTGYNC